ncbi:MAG TPA: nitroreductase family deazaflavin-dependent oxidoreductase [Candidatus Limnocylindrales bacterium]|nr:nitroreductase family deazaflavin-dependent oxidoreductase [Candidatus Limnocylindrales bacterium]
MKQPTRPPFLPPRWIIRAAWAVHRGIYRISGGRRGLRPPTPKTYGTLRVHTIGRRSGAERAAILGYFEDGPNLFTLAMNGWGEPEPAWWLNLQAHPDATIDLSDETTRPIRARAATGDERERLWGEMQRREPNLEGYAARRPRETAVVVFEPRVES